MSTALVVRRTNISLSGVEQIDRLSTRVTELCHAERNALRYAACMTQIAVKLPDGLVQELDDLVARGVFPNRSSAVRLAVEAIIDRQRRDALERAFLEGYQRLPESDGELAEARRLAAQVINDEPWDKWW